jgi:hypothetical protein
MKPGLAFAVVVVVVGGSSAGARGAALRVQGAPSCVEAEQIAEQVGVVLGRPLASVPDVSFALELAPVTGGSWRLHLDILDARVNDGAPRSRELTAGSCAELADAAAVAIAMSVRALEADEPTAAAPPPARVPAPPPAGEAVPAAVITRSQPAASARVTPLVTIATLAGMGALPSPSLGVQLDAGVRVSFVRVVARGALFASREKRLSAGGGGDFTLMFGALLACAAQAVGRPTVLGCAGVEVGRQSGEGLDVGRPRLGNALWLAPTVEAGAAWPLTPKLAVTLRVGAAAPLRRPEFVIDPTVRIHRAGSLDGRAALGLEWAF